MSFYELRPKAREDMKAIYRYGKDTWGANQAKEYGRAIYETFQLLADNPEIGLKRETIPSRYRIFPKKAHIVVMRHSENGILIVRVLHKSMDVKRHISE